jgi:tRNA(Ile2) C34 agmatinyltransferase TiaS
MSPGILATKHGLLTVVALLAGSGSICPDCGYGTRATSKKWAACKKCGRKRIPRIPMETVAEHLKQKASMESQESVEP